MYRDRLLGLPYVTLLLTFFALQASAQQQKQFSKIDVRHYNVRILPDIADESIRGKVTIHFLVKEVGELGIELNCGNLTIDSVYEGNNAVLFAVNDKHLRLDMKNRLSTNQTYKLVINYHGKPRRGVNFFPAIRQMYTSFFTSHWVVCKDDLDDKATLQLNLVVPEDLQVVSNGTLIGKSSLPNHKIEYEWNQKTAVPAYVFGFVVGSLNKHTESKGEIKLEYFGEAYSQHELSQIFRETRGMMKFFEDRSGIPYPGTTFSLVLAEGNVSQEMADFAILRNSYGKQILDNEVDINLAAHELAHQWWGNQITCLSWRHFWLNEGLAVFMSSAYKEFRFGMEEYLKDIDIYFQAYQKVVTKGKDKSLVFDNWDNPSSDDRILVYYKGAYVLHLLRKKLGEEAFWKGIRIYSNLYFGKSVVSANLQKALEEASGEGLDVFFEKWVY